MKFLIITSDLPYPLDQGSKIRSFRLLEQLSQHGEVFLFSLSRRIPAPQDLECLETVCRKVRYVVSQRGTFRKIIDVLKSVLFPRPYLVLANTSRELKREIAQTVAAEEIDVVQIHELCVAENIDYCEPRPRIVLDAHNAEAMVQQRLVSLPCNSVVRLFRYIQAKKTARYERRIAAAVDAVFAVSPSDVVYFSQHARYTRYVPNCVSEVNRLEGVSNNRELLFTGSLEYQPNSEGLVWFLRDIWPLVKGELPGVSFNIVARSLPESAKRLCGEGVHFYQNVCDIEPILQSSGVMVVPLRAGGGTRFKILQAFASGLPVVSTSIGAEGLRATDGIHLYLRDTAEGFAKAVVSLLSHKTQRQLFADAGAELIEKWYLWERAFPVCLETYDKILR